MKLTVFSTHDYDRDALEQANAARGITLHFLTESLNQDTAVLAQGSEGVCVFVHDRLDRATLTALQIAGVQFVLLRCAGYDHLDETAAKEIGLGVARVPAYSPHAIAEHAVLLLQALNRRLKSATLRTAQWNFALEGLLGRDLSSSTVGVFGTGRIGRVTAEILLGYGATVLAHDFAPDAALEARGVRYVTREMLLSESEMLSVHVPLCAPTRHLIDRDALALMRPDALLVNTARGPVVDTQAVLEALEKGRLGGYAMDVYEHEAGLFFADHSKAPPDDALLKKLMAREDVLVTPHQAFFTREALANIAETSLASFASFMRGEEPDTGIVVRCY
jgi:D-lactate dehydrogenase